MKPDSKTEKSKTWKNSHLISFERFDFQNVENWLIVIHGFSIGMLTALTVDEILLLGYMKWYSNFTVL